jgi:hypothetical protein
VTKPFALVVTAAVAAVTAVAVRRRQQSADAAELWREATSDASR